MRSICLFSMLLLSSLTSKAQNAFQIVPLGVKGGFDDSNLSAYLIAPAGSGSYVSLDAGSIQPGIRKAIQNYVFKATPDQVLRKFIKGYLISHPHLDHISGMIINSVDDTSKVVYGREHCIKTIREHYFNWQSWPNLGQDGAAPALKKYKYETLTENMEVPIENTNMHVTAFPLAHSNPYESAAFLIRSGDNFALYFGDTGPDAVEKSDKMENIWKAVAPLVKQNKLKGIFLEVSYPNSQPDRNLYGHLTPRWFFQELSKLGELAGNQFLKKLPVIVTHMKPNAGNEEKIREELKRENKLDIQLIFPDQGVLIYF